MLFTTNPILATILKVLLLFPTTPAANFSKYNISARLPQPFFQICYRKEKCWKACLWTFFFQSFFQKIITLPVIYFIFFNDASGFGIWAQQPLVTFVPAFACKANKTRMLRVLVVRRDIFQTVVSQTRSSAQDRTLSSGGNLLFLFTSSCLCSYCIVFYY